MKPIGAVVRTFEGERIPEKIVWNGRSENGEILDGEYVARFEVAYDMGNRPQAQSAPFYIDTESPTVEVRFGPTPFSPDGDGINDLLEFDIDIDEAGAVERWSLTIIDPRGKLFRQYKGAGTPPKRIYWNGISTDGDLVQGAEEYPFEFYVEDTVGNSAAHLDAMLVDILVAAENGNKRIRITGFTFKPNSPELDNDNVQTAEKNRWILEKIAEIFRRYADYGVTVEGHAVSVYWDDPERAKYEQDNELVPLSQARAETIRKALISLGINAERIRAVGIGGAKPVVPHGDIDNRWQNRRIEFILHK